MRTLLKRGVRNGYAQQVSIQQGERPPTSFVLARESVCELHKLVPLASQLLFDLFLKLLQLGLRLADL